MPPSSGRARPAEPDVVSAGVVVFGPHKRVLLVHRPKYDDWSFPKGKLEPGEHQVAAAVRETEEETGLRVRLGAPLRDQHYAVTVGLKRVHYWTGRPLGGADVSGYRPNAEIDAVRWVDVARAPQLLTHPHDRDTLQEALARDRKTRTLIVLRHGIAQARKTWRGHDDRRRPLLVAGRRQADRLAPLLNAYGVRQVVSSSSARCMATVAPYAALEQLDVESTDALSEEDASPAGVRRLVLALVAGQRRAPRAGRGLVVCAHRPVLPWIFDAVGVDDPHLEKGEMLVLHLATRGGRHGPVACERLAP